MPPKPVSQSAVARIRRGTSGGTIKFPTPMPSSCATVVAGAFITTRTIRPLRVKIYDIDKRGFRYRLRRPVKSTGYALYWYAWHQ